MKPLTQEFSKMYHMFKPRQNLYFPKFWNKLIQMRKDLKYKIVYGGIIYKRQWLQTTEILRVVS